MPIDFFAPHTRDRAHHNAVGLASSAMLFKHPGSKSRFLDYLRRRKDKTWSAMDKAEAQAAEVAREQAARGLPVRDQPKKSDKPPMSRSFGTLFREFWRLLRGHHRTVIAALGTLSLSTGLRSASMRRNRALMRAASWCRETSLAR